MIATECDMLFVVWASLSFKSTRDIDQVDLSSFTFVGGVDHDHPTVSAGRRVSVASPFACVSIWREQMGDGNFSIRADLVEVRMLDSTFIWIRIVQNPIVLRSGHICVMPIGGH